MKDKLREELFKTLLGNANEMDIHAENSVHLMVNNEILPLIQRHIDAEYVKISDLPTVYIEGYEQGHNDTVEGSYGYQEEKAETYIEEALHARINQKEKNG